MKCVTRVLIAALWLFDGTIAQGIIGSILSRADKTVSNVISRDPCHGDHVHDFEKSLAAFSTALFKQAAMKSGNHFVISPLSMWLILASMAEGADETIQPEYMRVLKLPKDMCVRKEYYKIALGLETPGTDVKLLRKRLIIFGNNLLLNAEWVDFVREMNLLEMTTEAKNSSLSQAARLTGTSLLIDSLDYDGLWTTAFPKANVKRSTFYDEDGKAIGTVELMRMKNRVRMAHLSILNAKVLELPVGKNGRYTMLIAMGLEKVKVRRLLELFHSSLIVEILKNLIRSLIPIEIAIPKFIVATKYDARQILEEIGLKSIWYNSAATRYISEPAPIPSNFMQQVKVKFDSAGINPPPRTGGRSILSTLHDVAINTATGFAAAVGRDFIANRPFLYTLIDTKTNSILFTGAFSKADEEF